jgi:hypothetical protein
MGDGEIDSQTATGQHYLGKLLGLLLNRIVRQNATGLSLMKPVAAQHL